MQRINLTTALGTSLVNTLFVLDEPSIGLHPRDMLRVIGVMKRLRDAGNSLVVVEHDPQIMLEADRILDMGPGAGERGGEIVFFGTPDEHRAQPQLADRRVSERAASRRSDARRRRGIATAAIAVAGAVRTAGSSCAARASTISRTSTCRIPLRRLVCITGVSARASPR